MPSFPVLLVEDKDSLRAMLRHALEAQGHVVVEACDEADAVQQMRQARPAVVLTDLKLPTGDGFGVLRAAKELDPELQVIVMTAYGSIQDAVTAMREGAMDLPNAAALRASSARTPSCGRSRSSCTAPRRPMPRCCSKAKAERARSCLRGPCTP